MTWRSCAYIALPGVRPANARKLNWSTTTPHPGPALTQARLRHHAETCGQSLVSARAGERRDVLRGLCDKSHQLPLASCTGAPPRVTPVPPLLRHDRDITPRFERSRL